MTTHRSLLRLGLLGALAALAAVPAAGAGASSSKVASCSPAVDSGVLPPWARGGFSDARPKIAHVTGRSGSIMAILFAQPLEAPPAKTHNNKILWVAKDDIQKITDLRIAAQRMVGAHAVGDEGDARRHGRPGPLDHRPAGGRLLAPRAALVGPLGHARRALRAAIRNSAIGGRGSP